MLRARVWVPFVVAALCGASRARSETPKEPESIRLQYTAPPGCLAREAFVGRLKARTAKFREALEGEAARVFTIEITSAADSARGRLTVNATDGSVASRDVRAATCDQVEAALVLVVAVAIDPQALLEAAPPASEPEPRPAPTVVPPASGQPRDEPRALRDGRRAHMAVGLRWDEVSGITPLLRPVLRPFVEWALDAPRAFAPALRISFAWTRNAHVAASANGADISWYAGRAEACPLHLGSDALSLTPCATFDAGALRVVGQDAPPEAARTRPWLSAGIDARGSMRVWRWIFTEIEVGAAAPWIKDRWLFADGTTLRSTPVVTGWAAAGFAFRFP